MGYWVGKVTRSVDKFRNTFVKPEGEYEFYRATVQVAEWEIIV